MDIRRLLTAEQLAVLEAASKAIEQIRYLELNPVPRTTCIQLLSTPALLTHVF
jgi:hypothetical protein